MGNVKVSFKNTNVFEKNVMAITTAPVNIIISPKTVFGFSLKVNIFIKSPHNDFMR